MHLIDAAKIFHETKTESLNNVTTNVNPQPITNSRYMDEKKQQNNATSYFPVFETNWVCTDEIDSSQ